MRLYIFILFFLPSFSFAQSICTTDSRVRLDSTLTVLSQIDIDQIPISELALKIARGFINTPYVEKTLEVPGDEPLVIDLMGLDCTTYLEMVVTFARMVKLGLVTFEDYEKELECLRYRNGQRDHYPSRLHYFSDWIYENEQKGIIKDVTNEIGGLPYSNPTGFMSENPQHYAQLKNAAYIEQMKNIEKEISSREYYYLPKERIEDNEHNIKPGDLIAITISMDNLDISHVGFAVMKEGRVHLMHASSASKKVEISSKPLSEYLMGHKSQSGIMVCRLVEPG